MKEVRGPAKSFLQEGKDRPGAEIARTDSAPSRCGKAWLVAPFALSGLQSTPNTRAGVNARRGVEGVFGATPLSKACSARYTLNTQRGSDGCTRLWCNVMPVQGSPSVPHL